MTGRRGGNAESVPLIVTSHNRNADSVPIVEHSNIGNGAAVRKVAQRERAAARQEEGDGGAVLAGHEVNSRTERLWKAMLAPIRVVGHAWHVGAAPP